jgi:hypothetical protein
VMPLSAAIRPISPALVPCTSTVVSPVNAT